MDNPKNHEKTAPSSRQRATRGGLAAAGALFIGVICICGGIFLALSWKTGPRRDIPPLIFPTYAPYTPTPQLPTVAPNSTQPPGPALAGKIVYVCQLFKLQASDQICLINADGTGQQRLTTHDKARHYYPSLAPDGQSVLFSSNMDGNFEIYELELATGQLTRYWQPGIAPEVSPDNRAIAFTQANGDGTDAVWVMERDGQHPRRLYANGWDPTWSPDGKRILFASNQAKDVVQLMSINLDGSDLRQITDIPLIRGRSDWSPDGASIVTYAGKPWNRQVYLLNADGSQAHPLTAQNGNGQGPSFSPDGQWVAFTAYFDHPGQGNGCEIYLIRIDGTNLTRLTDNDYCDWQPRWGP